MTRGKVLTWHLKATVLLALSSLLISLEGKSNRGAPPVIVEVSPAKINEPETYVQIARTIYGFGENELRCVAENADDVFWKYRPTLDAEYTTALPVVMKQLPLQDDGSRATRILTDKRFTQDDRRPQLDGYYQCFARSNFGGNEYQSLSPPLRIIYADIHEVSRMNLVDTQTLYPGILPTIGKPYHLPCIRDPSLGQGGYQLNPPDAAAFAFARVSFQWSIRSYSSNSLRRLDFNSATYAGRARMDPRTGDLYFTELKAEDALPSSGSSVYQCSVLIGYQPEVITNVLFLSIAANPGPNTALVVQYPLVDEQRSVTCIVGLQCKLVALFGGTESTNKAIKIIPPSSVWFNQEPYGASFTPTSNKDSGDWVFKMASPSPSDQSVLSITLKVSVLAIPWLPASDNFPSQRLVFSGDQVTYECNPYYSEAFQVNFYINGVDISKTQPQHVTYAKSQPTMFSIDRVMRNQSASIACIATNYAGTMFKQGYLFVLDKPQSELHPEVAYNLTADDSSLYFNCSFTLDERTDPDSVKLWWRSNHPKLENNHITSGDNESVVDVEITAYSTSTSTIESEIFLELNNQTQSFLGSTDWWCECSYKVFGNDAPLTSTKQGHILPFDAANESYNKTLGIRTSYPAKCSLLEDANALNLLESVALSKRAEIDRICNNACEADNERPPIIKCEKGILECTWLTNQAFPTSTKLTPKDINKTILSNLFQRKDILHLVLLNNLPPVLIPRWTEDGYAAELVLVESD